MGPTTSKSQAPKGHEATVGCNCSGYALETAARLLNIEPSKTVAQTPYQIWHGKPASYKYLRVWGSPAYVKRQVEDKLDSRSSLCRFIGYPKESEGYYFYDPSMQKVFVSRNVVFLERGFPTDTQRDELLLEEASEAPQSNARTLSAPTIFTDNVPILRRSARVPQPPERGHYSMVIHSILHEGFGFKMEYSKRGFLLMRHGVKLSKKQSPKTDEELKRMLDIPYASVVVYDGGELILEGFSDASFQSDDDDTES
ncbi:UNVERIFIED_CONTAM: hypothetical protein Scaly_1650100 [Sesamum calycinum]|uniref:Retroviral polymerase SH3-like domain-containing protein n=1 Tax=Sesamum calycinum TaxID=2727403 RepID=A0AAW2PCU9_9LAMI